MKRWLYIGAVILVLIVIGLYILFSSLNSIGQAATRAATSLPDVGKLVGSAGETAKGAGEGLKKLFGK